MPIRKPLVVCAWLCVAGLGGGCEPKRIPPVTVTDLVEDRVTLDGVIMKCNANPDQARNDSDCLNARIALERLAKDTAPAEEAKRSIEFERSREALRQTQERMRKDQEARTTVDAYNLPVMPIYPVPSPSGDSAAQPKP